MGSKINESTFAEMQVFELHVQHALLTTGAV
jgi:hypothetical protein